METAGGSPKKPSSGCGGVSSSSSWCSFESVPPPTPFAEGSSSSSTSVVALHAAHSPVKLDESISLHQDWRVGEDGGVAAIITPHHHHHLRRMSDPGGTGLVVPARVEARLSILSASLSELNYSVAGGEDEGRRVVLTSLKKCDGISSESSSSSSSVASDARISSAPLCSGQLPHPAEHTLSDISGPCSSSLIVEMRVPDDDDDDDDGFITPRSTKPAKFFQRSNTTSSTTSTSSSRSETDTDATEDHREFCLQSSSSPNKLDSCGGAAVPSFTHNLDVVPMTVDTCEDYWTRLHDIRINGSVLEYTGMGKSIHDNGFAQSNVPLTPLNHYFEITILDPGESSYIAIGLARKDYNVRRNPGWCRGSIAYHADDGKIFIGGGVGTPFGPRCSVNDVLGCGIVFPPKYGELSPESSWPWEAEDGSGGGKAVAKARVAPPRRRRPGGNNTDNFGEVSSESEDDIWWNNRNQVCEDKVKVFFMRNRKLLGIKEVRIPKGGFYPTIGMMSTNERVSVDLHPLTG